MNSVAAPLGNRWGTIQMTRLVLHVEGETEESFVTNVLSWHLYSRGYTLVSARPSGGIKPWPTTRKEILRYLKQDAGCVVSTMVDYYGLPQRGSGAWPGRTDANRSRFPQKAKMVEDELLADICNYMGSRLNPDRFVPYVMMHEYEAMLFSDCAKFCNLIGRNDLLPQFQAIRNAFGSPEEIDDSPQTVPSKRIEKLVPGYRKPLFGTLGVLEIGLDAIRRECPHFQGWLKRLESGRSRNTVALAAGPR